MDENDPRVRFMSGLAALCAPDKAAEVTPALVRMIPMLGDVAPECWRARACLDDVATARMHGVPSYAEIRRAMTNWQRENVAPTRALSHDHGLVLTEDDYSWVKFFQRRSAEGFGAAPGSKNPTSRALCLDLLQAQAPMAWHYVNGTKPQDRREPTEEERAAVRAAVRDCVAEMGGRAEPLPHAQRVAFPRRPMPPQQEAAD